MRSIKTSWSGSLAALLSWSLCIPAPAAVLPSSDPSSTTDATPRADYRSTELQGEEHILHALNRFTFGPRPGDLEAARAKGLEQWFDQQLHPASIDQTDLRARLAQFPAMQRSTQDLIYRLPSNAIIRQAANGQLQVPEQGVLHAIYENQIYRLQLKKSGDGDKKQPAASSMTPESMSAGPQAGMAKPASMNGMEAANDPMSLQTPPQIADNDAPVAALLALAPQQRLAHLAEMQPVEFDSFSKSLRPVQRLQLVADMTPEQREIASALDNPQRTVVEELLAQRMTRDIYSNAQLQEVMTDFWLNHFNIYLQKDEQMSYYLVSYERDVIRPLALGKFEDLLEAVAHSPAMMLYLDNATSMGPDSPAAERAKIAVLRNPNRKKQAPEGLNENYGRELMELHTLGVNGGYTQADVTQVARVLTGWTVDRPQRGGGFQFNENRHEPGTKKVMGQKIKDGGEREGRKLLHMLAMRPATAQFLSRKLAIRFVSDQPSQALVDRMAKSYLASGGDIPTVLKTLFHSPEFWAASDERAKVKTPLEFVVSALRASNADVKMYQPLIQQLRQMGMPLYGCVPPTGYNWQASTWVSTGALVDRMNFALSLAANRLPGVTVAWTSPLSDANSADAAMPTPEREEARLEHLLVTGGVSISTRSAALEQFQAQIVQANSSARIQPAAQFMNRTNPSSAPSRIEKEDELLAGLLIGSPEFQRR